MTTARPTGLVAPAIATALAFSILMGLGAWQLARRQGKLTLNQAIAARADEPPVPLSQALSLWQSGQTVEFLRVRVTGVFDHARERHMFVADPRGPGYELITPLDTPGATVLIDRGYVPEALKAASLRPNSQPQGEVEIIGQAHAPERKGLFTPPSEPKNNIYFYLDLPTMSADLANAKATTPFFLEAEPAGAPNRNTWPKAAVIRRDLPNPHLAYALTWFGLGLTLLGVFATFALAKWRDQPPIKVF